MQYVVSVHDTDWWSGEIQIQTRSERLEIKIYKQKRNRERIQEKAH